MSLWSPDLDMALHAARAATPDAEWKDVAAALNAKTGAGITADAARNRYKRILEQIAIDEAYYNRPLGDEPFLGLHEPEDGFVGFRQVFYDLETTALSGIMGRILCASFCDSWGNVKTLRITDFPQTSIIDDSGVARAIRDELEQYDMMVGWFTSGFDRPMLNARLLYHGERPLRSDIMDLDPIYKARGGKYGAKIGSSKLDNVAKYFKTPEQKTPLDWETWQRAAAGDKDALDQVVIHCEADVRTTRLVFNHLKSLISIVHR